MSDDTSISDTALLDFLEKQGQGKRWIARPSRLGRGYRLHNCEADEFPVTHTTAREALAAAVKEEGV